MEIQVTKREVLLIVTALASKHKRIGQKVSWQYRKRLPLLRSRLADCITIGIGDGIAAINLKNEIELSKRRIRQGFNIGVELSDLRKRLKEQAGITDERIDWDGNDDNETPGV